MEDIGQIHSHKEDEEGTVRATNLLVHDQRTEQEGERIMMGISRRTTLSATKRGRTRAAASQDEADISQVRAQNVAHGDVGAPPEGGQYRHDQLRCRCAQGHDGESDDDGAQPQTRLEPCAPRTIQSAPKYRAAKPPR